MQPRHKLVLATTAALTLAGCATPMMTPDVPSAIAVPAGNKAVMMSVGDGELTYECRLKAGSTTDFEWAFVAPTAVLYNRDRTATIGKYYGGPTWESSDGSKVTGKQLAISPGRTGAIPLQLVEANPATGSGSMMGVTYIQRLNTVGGTAPTAACNAGTAGRKENVKYKADYVFYKK